MNLVVDYSFLCHSGWSVCNSSNYNSGLSKLVGYFNSKIRKICRTVEQEGSLISQVILVEDSVPIRKFQIYPDYKLSRITAAPVPKDDLKAILQRTSDNYTFCHASGFEADDAIAAVCALFQPSIIVSCDRDLWQLFAPPAVRIYEPINHRFIQVENLKKAFRVENPVHIPLVKALWGDSGDGVPNILPRTQKTFLPLILQSDGALSSFQNLVRSNWDKLGSDRRIDYIAAENQLIINFELVKLNAACELIWS